MTKRLAIVGCGGIAEAHAFAIAQMGAGRCQIAALCDHRSAQAADFAQRFAPDAPIFASLEALLEAMKPDALLICTPPATHARLARRGLEHGVAVLCEKPLCTESAAARELCELATAQGVILRTAAKYRFTAGVLEAKKWLKNGALGQLKRMEIAFGSPVEMRGRWQADAAQSGGGVWMDNGPHAVDLARFLLGEAEIRAIELRFGADFDVEEEAKLQLASESGVPIEIELSWRRSLGENFLRIEGESGTLNAGWNTTIWQPSDGKARVLAPHYDKSTAFASQLKLFLSEISPGATPNNIWQTEDGLRAVEIIAAGYSRWARMNS